ncbi:MAG TPA: glycosyltransferase family 2 protein [Humisphaera sp.]|jgi:hypothetical protein|nr:glycosyltransferase family 2 protein [Humisphaera sp.]
MRLLIVIVNYRTASLVIDCLRSLADQIAVSGGAKVVITDNASGDDSVPRLREAIDENGWSSWASVQPLDHNGGFAFGNNAGIRPALKSDDPPQFVLLLNPDTVVKPGAVAALLQFMDAHPQVGIAGARLEFPDGSLQASACRFQGVLSELENGMRLGLMSRLLRKRIVAPSPPADASQVDWVSGACLLVRREVLDQIGLLDEEFFMYYEEVDFCRRAAAAGWPCWYVPEARVVHLVGQSSGHWDPKQPKKRRPQYWFASRRRYFLKHLGRARTFLADVAWASGFASYRLRRAIQRKPDGDPDRLLQDFLRYNFLSRAMTPSSGTPGEGRGGGCAQQAPVARTAPTLTLPRGTGGGDNENPSDARSIGVVVIGRNEGERLRRCLTSVVSEDRHVIYVDSNSTDGSRDVAASLGATVVALDMSIPFSAARARNAGVEKLLEIDPDAAYVQFVDGDCEMIDGWLERARLTLSDHSEIAAIAGRLRERSPEQSIYNRLADIEWDTPTGEVKSCGGIAMMRLSAFRAAGGFDPTVVAGEEPELCQRLRDAGAEIMRLPDQMAWHDSAIFHFGQWWKRSTRGGYGAMDVAARFGRGRDGLFVRQVRSARLWGIGPPLLIVIAAIVFALWPGRWWSATALIIALMIGPIQILRMALRARRRMRTTSDALAYGALMLVGKWANLLGQYRYFRDRAAGRHARLIEYKSAPSSPSSGTPGEGRGGGCAGAPPLENNPHPNPPPEYRGRELDTSKLSPIAGQGGQ